MSALAELIAGCPGTEFVALLQRVVRAVGPGDGFPPPEDHERWDSSAIMTCVAEFFASPQIERRLKDLSICSDEEALKAKLHPTVRNFLADQGRKTTVGRLVLRFNEVLGKSKEFERRGPYWARIGDSAGPAEVDRDALLNVVNEVQVVVPTAYTTGERKSPELDAPSVLRIAEAALASAGGPLIPGVLAEVTAVRLGLRDVPLSVDADGFAQPRQFIHDSQSSVHVDASLKDGVAKVISRLDERQLVALGAPEASSTELGEMLGISSSLANTIKNRAIAIVRDELVGDDGGELVANAVLDVARSWLESWMVDDDPT